MRENTTTRHSDNYLQRDFDALAMAIEDGLWTDTDPRAAAFIEAARSKGLVPDAVEVYEDTNVPAPVRERAFACIAGRVLADADYALAG